MKAKARAELEQQLTQKNMMIGELERAEKALNKGINMGTAGQIATGVSKLPLVGGYLADKEQGQRTELFDSVMNKVAIGQMGTALKGQNTDFEMKKFITLWNNPSIPMEAKRAQFADVLKAAKKDRDAEARAVQATGGDISNPITKPADPLEGRTATGPNGEIITRRNGKWE